MSEPQGWSMKLSTICKESVGKANRIDEQGSQKVAEPGFIDY